MIVVPPHEVQRRSWECSHVLRDEYRDRMTLADRVLVEVIYRHGPAGLGWREVSAMIVLYGEIVEVRV
jgi:hypothetical protein